MSESCSGNGMRIRSGLGLVLFVLVGWAMPLGAQVVHEDIAVYATDAGALVGLPEPGLNAIFKNENICFPSDCLYSSSNPGVITPSSGTGAYSRVAPGTRIFFEIVEIDPAASVRVGPVTLDEAGESADLGTASSLHVHPAYQVVVPEGQLGAYPVRFRFVADSGYAPSPVYELSLSNQPEPTPGPTPGPTPEPTPEPTPAGPVDCVGDRTYEDAVAEACETITGGSLRIESTDLTDVDGLTMLDSIDADLIVENNNVLSNLDGLAGLTSLGGDFRISNNPALCQTLVDELLNAISVGGSQFVSNNDDSCDPACDTGGALVFKPLLKATNFSTNEVGDKLKYKAKLIFDGPVSIDPLTRGFRLRVSDADGAVLVDLEVPAGVYDPVARSGWISQSSGKKFQYRTTTPLAGLVPKIILKTNSKKPNEVTVIVIGKSGSFADPGVRLPLAATVSLDPTDPDSNLCAETEFPGPKPQPYCRRSGNGVAVTCR